MGSREPPVKNNAVLAKGADLRVSFKNTYNTARAVRGMTLTAAKTYLTACLNKQRCIPQRRFCGSTGRTGQAKEWGTTKGRWPSKSIKIVLGLGENMLANANFKQLDAENSEITHVQVNTAPKGRRRTYRAHGRITPFMSNPCHVEMFASIKSADVAKEKRNDKKGCTKVALARANLKNRLATGSA